MKHPFHKIIALAFIVSLFAPLSAQAAIDATGLPSLRTLQTQQTPSTQQAHARQQKVAQAFGEVANQAVGDLASKLKDYYQTRKAEAEYNLSRAKANGDDTAIKAAQADLESSKSMEKIWSDGGMAKIALHTIVGGVQAGIGGGNIGAGALAGLTSEAAVPYLSDALKAMKVEEGSELYKSLMKVGAAAVGAGAGAVVGGNANAAGSGASTALANIENNYLKHQEILDKNKRLAACKSKEECNKIEAEYKQLSETRDNKLATCVGDNSETCQGLRQEVRYAYAEIIRYGSKNIIYGLDSEKTKIQADRTLSMSDRLEGTGSGFANSVVEGLVGLGKGLMTATLALTGDEASKKSTNEFLKQLSNDPGRVIEAILNQTPEQREKLAQAYERGDAYEVGKVTGEIFANMPTPIGGGLGTIGKIGKAGKIADEIGDIAKAEKAANRGAVARDADVLAPDALRLRTQLSFEQAGILTQDGKLTEQAIINAKKIDLTDGVIQNPDVVKILTRDGSSIQDWKKFSTESTTMPNGQSMQIHFYQNTKTGAVDYMTQDFKVKGIVKP